jgi:hypothetical protein
MKLCLLLVAVAMQLTACLSIPGDGIVRVVGEIVTETSCAVSLADPKDPDRVLDTKPVHGQFSVNFLVPSTLRSYVVSLSCNGALFGTRHVTRPQRQAADFGRVTL